MARAHFVTYLLDSEGRPIPGATVNVREPDTENAISETIYAADDPDGTTKSNPFTSDADGKCEIWLANPKVVDLYVTKTGYDPSTIRATAHQLTASTLTLKEAGTPLAQRAGVNFGSGFDLSDDAVNDETDIAIDLTELSVFTDHSARHENGGADEISLAGLDGVPTELTNHLNDPADAHDASAISIVDSAGDFTATDVEGALAELQADAEAHLADAADAHDASAISVADAGGLLAATNVEAALAEIQGNVDTDEAALASHLADGTDAHDASAISIVDAAGDFTATDVEGALAELQSDNEAFHHSAAHDANDHTFKGCRVYRTTDQSIPNGATTTISFDAESFDTDGFHEGVTNPSRITIPAAYDGMIARVTAGVQFPPNANGLRVAFLESAGPATKQVVSGGFDSTGTVTDSGIVLDSGPVVVAAGDIWDLKVRQGSGGALNAVGGEYTGVFMSIEILGT